MHRFRAWGLSAALAAGAAAPAAGAAAPAAGADDPAPAPTRSSGPPTTLYAKLFGPAKPKKGPVARDGVAAPTGQPPVVTPLPADVVENALRAEQEAWDRRMSVCLKLRQVAFDKNDDDLLRQVDDLERQATAVYTARVAALGLKAQPAPLRPHPDDEPATDLKTAARRLTAPAPPAPLDPAVRTAEARTPTDVVREVMP